MSTLKKESVANKPVAKSGECGANREAGGELFHLVV